MIKFKIFRAVGAFLFSLTVAARYICGSEQRLCGFLWLKHEFVVSVILILLLATILFDGFVSCVEHNDGKNGADDSAPKFVLVAKVLGLANVVI